MLNLNMGFKMGLFLFPPLEKTHHTEWTSFSCITYFCRSCFAEWSLALMVIYKSRFTLMWLVTEPKYSVCISPIIQTSAVIGAGIRLPYEDTLLLLRPLLCWNTVFVLCLPCYPQAPTSTHATDNAITPVFASDYHLLQIPWHMVPPASVEFIEHCWICYGTIAYHVVVVWICTGSTDIMCPASLS